MSEAQPDPRQTDPPLTDPAAAAPLQGRRSVLRAALWGGGVAGLGGLAGLTANRLLRARQTDVRPKPPLGKEFTYDVEHLQKSDPTLLRYTEIARFPCGLGRPKAVATAPDGSIFVGGNEGVRKFSPSGELVAEMPLTEPVHAIALRPSGELLVGQPGCLRVLDAAGGELARWQQPGEKFLPTSIAVTAAAIYVADAGGRVVLKLDPQGRQLAIIGARDLDRNLRGFVVPSPYFCVRMAPDGLLRISNPGEHQIEAFTPNGDLELVWGKGSFSVEGFCGCCNPVSFEVFPDGSFVTCEKGLPRVKLYDSHGGFTGLVAGPEAFPEYLKAANTGAPDTLNAGIYAAIDPQLRVIILDGVGGTVRIMQAKEKIP